MFVTLLLLTVSSSSTVTHLFPGAVASANASLGYFILPKGGVQAVDLSSGKQLWTSEEASWPLEAVGDELIAAKGDADPHKLRLIGMDSKSGTMRFLSEAISLPSWAKPIFNYDESLGYSFKIDGKPQMDGTILITWVANAWYAGGAPPPRRILEVSRKEARGTYSLNPKTGRLTPVSDAAVPPAATITSLGKPDSTKPSSFMLSPEVTVGPRTLYLSETIPARDQGRHPIRVVAIDPATKKLIWELSLGMRVIPPMPM
ncbi:MAG: hypothetical protein QOJ65_2697 [Fimbriimonadaceae bacterium]|jgi:outer membrane protein assembly factor BamB|nr:hypothetical protein [Fimbriimonadaceae bacterium]